MRKRAERRLGPKFAELLGQCHRFKAVTPELLADYVSAGDDNSSDGQASRAASTPTSRARPISTSTTARSPSRSR